MMISRIVNSIYRYALLLWRSSRIQSFIEFCSRASKVMSRQMHFEREFVHQSIKKASTGSISFDELSFSLPHVMHWPRFNSLPFLDVAVAILSVSVTRRHFKQYIFNIRKNFLKMINIKNGSKKSRLEWKPQQTM